jgi:hypothetical protein
MVEFCGDGADDSATSESANPYFYNTLRYIVVKCKISCEYRHWLICNVVLDLGFM